MRARPQLGVEMADYAVFLRLTSSPLELLAEFSYGKLQSVAH